MKNVNRSVLQSFTTFPGRYAVAAHATRLAVENGSGGLLVKVPWTMDSRGNSRKYWHEWLERKVDVSRLD